MWRLVESFERLRPPMFWRIFDALETAQRPSRVITHFGAPKVVFLERLRLPLVSGKRLIRDNFARKFQEHKSFGVDFRFRPNFEFRFRPKQLNDDSKLERQEEGTVASKTLVVLIGWVGAKKGHFDQHVALWHERGYDVMRIEMRLIDILFPMQTSRPNAILLTDTIDELRRFYPNILFHTFSSGSFLFGGMINAIANDSKTFGQLPHHLVGAIFDSVPEWNRSIESFCREAFEKHSRWFARNAIKVFLSHSCQPGKDLNFAAELRAVETNPFRLPMLFLISHKDVYSSPEWVESVARRSVERNIPVAVKCWDNSPHVQHHHINREEYEELTNRFVSQVLTKAGSGGLSLKGESMDKTFEI